MLKFSRNIWPENRQSDKIPLLMLLKWMIPVVALVYLAYKLSRFEHWDSLLYEWKTQSREQTLWLAMVLVLLPINLWLEAAKWKKIVSPTERLSRRRAFAGVLAGFSTGFFTPNRTGDFAGRILFLGEQNRKTGFTLSLFNSLTQNMVIAACGVPAAILFFITRNKALGDDLMMYFIIVAISFFVIAATVFLLPSLLKRIKSVRIREFTKGMENFSTGNIYLLLFLSILRFAVFSIQFYFMLRFFGVGLSPLEAFMAIPANYLFVTFTPSLAATEVAIRSSYAVFFIGSYSSQVVGIALAGAFIWMVNFVIPMIAGTVLVYHFSASKKSQS